MTTDELTLAELHALGDNSLLTATQAGRLLGVSPSAFARLVREGALEESRLFLSPQVPRYWKGPMVASFLRRVASRPASVATEAQKPATSSWPASASKIG